MNGIQARFAAQMEDIDCLLAAAFHPHYKLSWLTAQDDVKYKRVRDKLISLFDMNIMEEKVPTATAAAAIKTKMPKTFSTTSSPPQRMQWMGQGFLITIWKLQYKKYSQIRLFSPAKHSLINVCNLTNQFHPALLWKGFFPLGKMFSSLNVLHSQIVTLKCWYS
jgi:hypothetical protein